MGKQVAKRVKIAFEIPVIVDKLDKSKKEEEDDYACRIACKVFDLLSINDVFDKYCVDITSKNITLKKYFEDIETDKQIYELIKQQSEKND